MCDRERASVRGGGVGSVCVCVLVTCMDMLEHCRAST